MNQFPFGGRTPPQLGGMPPSPQPAGGGNANKQFLATAIASIRQYLQVEADQADKQTAGACLQALTGLLHKDMAEGNAAAPPGGPPADALALAASGRP